MSENVNNYIKILKENISLENIIALLETGSTSTKTNTKNSDYDIRIIVKDYKLIHKEIGLTIEKCKAISLADEENYSEYKFYHNNTPIHLIFYNMIHVDKCINHHKKSFISTVLEGRVVYSNEEVFNKICKECVRVKELILSDKSDLTFAKSLFVKAMSKYQNGYFEDSIYCFRHASNHLVKYYLLNKGIIFLKEQWILKSLRDFCERDGDYTILQLFRKIHSLEDGQAVDAKNCMINFTLLLKYVEV